MDIPPDGAWIDPAGRYRYLLWRTLDVAVNGVCVFVMLNPSTADAPQDDPTIRRCRSFANRVGCSRLEIVNLFAWRATRPAELPEDADEAAGPLNDAILADACGRADVVIVGWGASVDTLQQRPLRKRAQLTIARLPDFTSRLFHLGALTKDGHPRHPLYLRASAALHSFAT